MDYQEFQKQVAEKIRDYLPEQFKDAVVRINKVQKNNGIMLDSLNILFSGDNVAPNIYLNDYYQSYRLGRPLEDIMREITNIRIESQRNGHIDVNRLIDLKNMKDKIIFKVVGVENNQEMLLSIPHRIEHDMALIYQVLVGKSDDGYGVFTISNEIQEQMEISENQMFSLAVKNMQHEFPVVWRPVKEMIKEMTIQGMIDEMGIDFEDNDFTDFIKEILEEQYDQMDELDIPMYVLTNEDGFHGATALFYPDIKEKIAEEFGTNYFVLPSSIHETIIVPDNGMMDYRELKYMVNEINHDQVAAVEVLTGEVYYYDRKAKELTIAESKKEKSIDKEEISIADRLIKKQNDMKREQDCKKQWNYELSM